VVGGEDGLGRFNGKLHIAMGTWYCSLKHIEMIADQ